LSYDREIDATAKPVTFKRKPAKQGADWMFYIPRVYVENGIIDPNRAYKVEVRLLKEGVEVPTRSTRSPDPLRAAKKKIRKPLKPLE
jgi:hypothetical protein